MPGLKFKVSAFIFFTVITVMINCHIYIGPRCTDYVLYNPYFFYHFKLANEFTVEFTSRLFYLNA